MNDKKAFDMIGKQMEFLANASKNEMNLEDKFDLHDCHLSQDDGCATCEEYFWSKLAKHNEDEKGLENFLEHRSEQVQEEYAAAGQMTPKAKQNLIEASRDDDRQAMVAKSEQCNAQKLKYN